jgi:hypothetical protein
MTLLRNAQGVEDYTIDLEEEKVMIKGAINTQDLLSFLMDAGFIPTVVPPA